MKMNIDNQMLDELLNKFKMLVRCVDHEKFSYRGIHNFNYSRFIEDIIKVDRLCIIKDTNPNKVRVIMFTDNELEYPFVWVLNKQ